MTKIPLTKGKFALVDDEDFDFINQWKWHINTNGYAVRSEHIAGSSEGGLIPHGRHKNLFLHRVLTKTPQGMVVDHINRDKLDNRRSNLRICTHQENTFNQTVKKGSSIYKGVCWDNRAQKWMSYIHPDKKMKFLGYFPTERWAAMAYDIAAKDLFGKFAKLNFRSI